MFIVRFLGDDCELKYRTLGFTFSTVEEYKEYVKARTLKKGGGEHSKDAACVFGAAMQLKRLVTKLLALCYCKAGGPNVLKRCLHIGFDGAKHHLEERLSDQAPARTSATPPFWWSFM